MQIKNFIGIDVSKKTLDITILDSQGKQIYYEKIGNDNKSIKSRFTAIMRSFGIIFTEVVFCLEYTGVYNLPVLNLATKSNSEHLAGVRKPNQKKSGIGSW